MAEVTTELKDGERTVAKATLYESPDSWWGDTIADLLYSAQSMQNNALKNLVLNGALSSNGMFYCTDVQRAVSLDGSPALALRAGKMFGFKQSLAGNAGAPVGTIQVPDTTQSQIQVMWAKFTASNRETLAAIMQTHDAARFQQQVEAFYREIGVPNPSGVQGGSAAPDPRSTVGGENGTEAAAHADGKTFTQDEYLAALDKAESDFRANGDVKAYRAATEALSKALNEGRVK